MVPSFHRDAGLRAHRRDPQCGVRGFSAESLKNASRMQERHRDHRGRRVPGGRIVPLKQTTDEALKECPDVKTVVVLKRTGKDVSLVAGRDKWWHDVVRGLPLECEPEQMDPRTAVHPYTSGSPEAQGRPAHTGGYMVYGSLTHELFAPFESGP